MPKRTRVCSIANALEVIGERWSLLVLREVFFGVHRFDQIAANTGASRDVLATRLRKLVESGMLERRQYETHPPRYEYVLSEAARALHGVLATMMAWGDRHVSAGDPPTVWAHHCGDVYTPEVVCASCREPVRPEDLTLVHATWTDTSERALSTGP